MALNISVRDTGGLTLVATIERISDGFFWDEVTDQAFQSVVTFADKSISLAEGSAENAKSYTGSPSFAATESPGEVIVRIHKSSGDTSTRAILQTVVEENEEIAPLDNVYHADIVFQRDNANSQDEYTVTWYKNGERLTSGVTSPTIQVVKRSDGSDLVASVAMATVIAGTFKKDEITTNRQTEGESFLVIAGATIDGAARSFTKVVGRDS